MVQEAQVEHATCRHHWIIQPADGSFNLGVCQFCSEGREFKNSIDDVWDFEKLRLQSQDSFDFN